MTPLRVLFTGLGVLGIAIAHFVTTHRADVRQHAATHLHPLGAPHGTL